MTTANFRGGAQFEIIEWPDSIIKMPESRFRQFNCSESRFRAIKLLQICSNLIIGAQLSGRILIQKPESPIIK